MVRRIPVLLAAGVVLAIGCSRPATDPRQPDRDLSDLRPYIITDREAYEPQFGWETIPGGPLPWDTTVVIPPETYWYLHFTVRMTYTNRSDQPVYVMAYDGNPLWPVPPRIERLENGTWTTAYDPPTVLLVRPRRIGPGEGFVHDFRVRAYDPHSTARVQPSWRPDGLDGVYRIVFSEYLIRRGEDESAGPAPLEARISNTFRIRGSLP